MLTCSQFTLRETYGPEILRRRARKLQKVTKDSESLSTVVTASTTNRSVSKILFRGLVRPFVFLATEPIVQVFALYMAVLYGLLYLTLVHFVEVYTEQYGQSNGIAGLHYLSIALGSTGARLSYVTIISSL
jgi:hypothetical protein